MNWNEVLKSVRSADAEKFATLRCPECGGRLKVEYVPRSQRDALYIECVSCNQIVRSTGQKMQPPWTITLGLKAETGAGQSQS